MKLVTFLAFLLLGVTPAGAADPTEIFQNNVGVDQLSGKNPRQAQMEFLEALRVNPAASEPRLNMGLTFESGKEWGKALKEYQAVLKNPDVSEDVRFYAEFNSARVLQELGKKDEALDHYQKALGARPDSLEAKANIELLMQENGGGGGSGDQQQPQQNQGDKGQQGQDPKQDQPPQDQQKQVEGLTQKDIEKILEELKNQEQKIRAQEYGSGPKEDRNGKDW